MAKPNTNPTGESCHNQFKELVNDIADNCVDLVADDIAISQEGLNNLAERADEFNAVIARALVYETRALSVDHHQADDDQVKPLFDSYFSNYEPKPIGQQVKELQAMIPDLNGADESIALAPLPEGAEGYFAVPRWEKLGTTYAKAVETMFTLLHDHLMWDVCEPGREGRLFNYRAGRLGPEYLRTSQRTKAAWDAIAAQQEGHDILVIPAQFGIRHVGRSIDYARKMMADHEFGLDTIAAGAMLLTHPRRMVEYDDLWLDCIGDEYSLNADGHYDLAPLYFFSMGQLEFDVINYERFRCGAVTGFRMD